MSFGIFNQIFSLANQLVTRPTQITRPAAPSQSPGLRAATQAINTDEADASNIFRPGEADVEAAVEHAVEGGGEGTELVNVLDGDAAPATGAGGATGATGAAEATEILEEGGEAALML